MGTVKKVNWIDLAPEDPTLCRDYYVRLIAPERDEVNTAILERSLEVCQRPLRSDNFVLSSSRPPQTIEIEFVALANKASILALLA